MCHITRIGSTGCSLLKLRWTFKIPRPSGALICLFEWTSANIWEVKILLQIKDRLSTALPCQMLQKATS